MGAIFDPLLGKLRLREPAGGGTPGGADLSMQFNDGGAFNGVGIGTPGQVLMVNGTGDGYIFSTPAGGGDVVGPASSTINAVAIFADTTGKLLAEANLIIADSGTSSLLSMAGGAQNQKMYQGGQIAFGPWPYDINTFAQAGFYAIAGNNAFASLSNVLDVQATAGNNKNYIATFNTITNGGSAAGTYTGEFNAAFSTAIAGKIGATVTRVVAHEGEAIIQGSTVGTLIGNGGRIIHHSGTATIAAALWARAIGGTHASGGIDTAYGLLVDSPGYGTVRYAMGVGQGDSYIAGRLHIGGATSPLNTVLKITQLAASASGNAIGIDFTAGAHTDMPNVDTPDVIFNTGRLIMFAGGEAAIPKARSVVLGGNVFYGSALVQEIAEAFAVHIEGGVKQGGNLTITDIAGALEIDDWQSNTPVAVNALIKMPGIASGVGSTNILASTVIGGEATLGNQTATTGLVVGGYFVGLALSSSTNTRTVTDAATVYIENAPTNNGNIIFTNDPWALWVDAGNVRLDGNLVMFGGTSGAVTFGVPATITNYTITYPNAQGAADTYLKNDGAGNLSWVTIAAGSSGWTDDGTNVRLTTITDKVGIGTASPVAFVDILQPNATSGSPLGFSFQAGDHTGLDNAGLADIEIALSGSKAFIGGGAPIEIVYGAELFFGGVFTASSSQTIETFVGLSISGDMPQSGANITQGGQVGVFIGEGGMMMYGTDINATLGMNIPSLGAGIGSTFAHYGLMFGDGESITISQTAGTTDEFALALFGEHTLNASAARTITDVSGIRAVAPIPGTNMTFTNGSNAITAIGRVVVENHGTADEGVVFPSVTTIERNSVNAVVGLVVFDTDIAGLFVYDGASWVQL